MCIYTLGDISIQNTILEITLSSYSEIAYTIIVNHQPTLIQLTYNSTLNRIVARIFAANTNCNCVFTHSLTIPFLIGAAGARMTVASDAKPFLRRERHYAIARVRSAQSNDSYN